MIVEKLPINTIDLTGQKFGKLTVLNYIGKSKWECVCECGNHCFPESYPLRNGITKSCGCYQQKRAKEANSGIRILKLENKKFGRLTVLEFSKCIDNESYWLCKCDCGNEKIISGYLINTGRVISCGCYRKEQVNKKLSIGKGNASLNALFRQYKYSAKNRNIIWELTKEEFSILTTQNCHYCNIEPSQKTGYVHYYGDYTYNGIDRVDNNLGYIFENCVSCCKECNYAKGQLSEIDFLNLIQRIYKNKYDN